MIVDAATEYDTLVNRVCTYSTEDLLTYFESLSGTEKVFFCNQVSEI